MTRAPETLAIRAVNQYRRRDIVGYLGLRLYLDSTCSTRDGWSERVASRLATYDPSPKYHTSLHFKERSTETGEIEYREISLPTPNEILAETALLAECANAGNAFCNSTSVYSYTLAGENERKGVFVPYFIGFRKRHADIAKAARLHEDGVVVYADIRRFYPSITAELAAQAWRSSAEEGKLPPWARDLGCKLLENHRRFRGKDEKGVLTGPMFSHLIANVVLREVDDALSRLLPGGYFRYVDDFALVGSRDDVPAAEEHLRELLNGLGLEFNSSKRLEIPVSSWLEGASDFEDEPHRVSWMTLVGRMKQLLLVRPDLTGDITGSLATEGFRIAPLDYSDVVREASYLGRFRELMLRKWFRRLMHRASPSRLVEEARILRSRYQEEFWESIEDVCMTSGFERKRRIYQLRRLASRLVYLADPRKLPEISAALAEVPEMDLHAAVFDALAKTDVSRLVGYGANAAHSVVQGLLSSKKPVICSPERLPEAARQARAVMVAHGLTFRGGSPGSPNDMEQFCAWRQDMTELRKKPNTYFGQLAHLHGPSVERRHEVLLTRAFDADEDMIVDIEDVLQQSY